VYTPEFKRNLRALAKKYHHIRSDVQPVIDKLEAGEVVGVQVPRTPYTSNVATTYPADKKDFRFFTEFLNSKS